MNLLGLEVDIMFVASTKFVHIMPLAAKIAPLWMSHVLFVAVLHPVNFVNITHIKS